MAQKRKKVWPGLILAQGLYRAQVVQREQERKGATKAKETSTIYEREVCWRGPHPFSKGIGRVVPRMDLGEALAVAEPCFAVLACRILARIANSMRRNPGEEKRRQSQCIVRSGAIQPRSIAHLQRHDSLGRFFLYSVKSATLQVQYRSLRKALPWYGSVLMSHVAVPSLYHGL